MNTFIEKIIDWLLDKEEKAANKGKIDIKEINHQIKQVMDKREKYQQEVDKTLHEFDNILVRLQRIKDKNEN